LDILQQLPNGGAVVAVIAVVMIFLKRQERYEERMDVIADKFMSEIAAARKDYLERLDRLTDREPRTP
jgi:hypothetical protein